MRLVNITVHLYSSPNAQGNLSGRAWPATIGISPPTRYHRLPYCLRAEVSLSPYPSMRRLQPRRHYCSGLVARTLDAIQFYNAWQSLQVVFAGRAADGYGKEVSKGATHVAPNCTIQKVPDSWYSVDIGMLLPYPMSWFVIAFQNSFYIEKEIAPSYIKQFQKLKCG